MTTTNNKQPVPTKEKPIRGLGITRSDLKAYLGHKLEEAEQRPDFIRELYEKDDLTLVTENTKQMVITKVRMKILLAAQDLERVKPLIQVQIEEFNKEMVSFMRQGRLEALGALQSLNTLGAEERPVSSR